MSGGHNDDKDRWFTIEHVYCIKHVRLVRVLLSECVWQTGVCLIYSGLTQGQGHTVRHLPGYPPSQGTPLPGYPPDWTWQGTPPPGYPPARVPPQPGYPPSWTWQGTPPGCPMAFWEMLQSIMGYGYPPSPVDRQIDGWKDRRVSKHYLPVVLRTRAVTSQNWVFFRYGDI